MRTLLCSHVIYLFISILSAIVYLPALGGGFVLDDGFNILQNHLLYVESLQSSSLVNAALSFHDGNGARPLPMLSFALDYWRAGSMDAATFKATNLFIHALTTFFLAYFLRRLLVLAGWGERRAMWGAGLLAVAWAVHPLQVSSVMYIVQRMQTMATLFVVLTLWAYLAMRQLQISGLGRGRLQGILMLVFWCLALACKEDAVLVFAYTLALELTVLRFKAVDPVASKGLKQSYLLLTVLGAVAYLFVVVPHFWSWDHYGTRDFSSLERLMTQSRVLMMYLGQILFPWPGNMTFLYDNYPVSRGLLSPWTTLPAILSVAGLLVWAWRWRTVRPLFSFGVLLFFAGHFITSNVIALELVFEHRNHLPLLGVVVAVADIFRSGCQRWSMSRRAMGSVLTMLVLVLSAITLFRAYIWGDSVRHGERMVSLMPESNRAWMQLSGVHFARYNDTQDTEHLVRAVEVIDLALEHVTSPTLASNRVIYKSLLGTATQSDWQQFFDVLYSTPPTWHDKFVLWTQMNNVDRGFELDVERILEGIDIVANKTGYNKEESLRVAIFIYHNGDPEDALPYFLMFARKSGNNDAGLISIISQLKSEGRTDWAAQMEKIRRSE